MFSSVSAMENLTGSRLHGAMTQHTNLTLVVGGTGKTGRRVAERLTALGHPVRIGSRSGSPPFDWNDPTTWAPVVRDVTQAYVAYYPDVAMPGALEQIRGFVETAVAAGVRRLVLLSGRGEPAAEAAEQVVRDSGVEWTILRCSWFAQNFSEHYLLEPVRSGVIALPAMDVAEPFVDVDDIADVAVAALTDDGHVGELYELTGPRALTFSEVAAVLSEVTGRSIRYVPVTPEQYVAEAVTAGLPAEEAEPLAAVFAIVLDGRNEKPVDGVERALGRPARDFETYARAAAATGVWELDRS
jgi:uncharacterized protein YbjT (DUF2867 family)